MSLPKIKSAGSSAAKIRRPKQSAPEYAAGLSRDVSAACDAYFKRNGMPYGREAWRQAMKSHICHAQKSRSN